jgi:WD40 repeat protein
MAVQSSSMGGINIFDPSSGKQLNSLIGHSNNLFYLEFSTDSKYLISGSLDKTVKIWDTMNGDLIKTIDFSGSLSLNSISISPDSKTATINETLSTKIYSLPNGLQVGSLPITKSLNKMVISPNAKTLAGVSNSTIYLFDNSTGVLQKEKTYSSLIRNISFNSSNNQLFVITQKEFEVLNIP